MEAVTLRRRRVLITGGLGFIGSNLARRCAELDAAVTVYDNLDPRSGGNAANLDGLEHRVEIVAEDIRDVDALSRAMRNQDIVFHCAAYTSHVNSMTDPLADIDVNCKGAINVLEAARQVSPDVKIVHLGTSTQVGAMRWSPIDEAHPERPADIYSANKSASEKYVLIYGSAHRLRTTVVRLANVYGPRANIASPHAGFVNYFIGLALQGLPMPVFGPGQQLRNVMYVDDGVDALLSAATSERSDGEVFFAVSDEHHDVLQIAAAIARCIGGSVQRVEWPRDRRAIEIGDAVISSARARRTLGWTARTTLEAGLARTREYYLPRLALYLERDRLAASRAS